MLSKVASQMGYSALRPKQEEMILDFVRGSDVFVSLPTGSGKSLCYSLLPGVFDEIRRLQGVSIVIVVSPTCCADERPGEGHDREEHPRRLRSANVYAMTSRNNCIPMCHEYLAKVTRRSFSPKPEVERLARETNLHTHMHTCTHTKHTI